MMLIKINTIKKTLSNVLFFSIKTKYYRKKEVYICIYTYILYEQLYLQVTKQDIFPTFLTYSLVRMSWDKEK